MNTESGTTGGMLKNTTVTPYTYYGRVRLPMLLAVDAFASEPARTNNCFAV